jgi:hypothetical protein
MQTCKECGAEFKAKNKKGAFCSNKCRQKDYRKNISVLIASARRNVLELPREFIETKKIVVVNPNTPIRRQGETTLDFLVRESEWLENNKKQIK